MERAAAREEAAGLQQDVMHLLGEKQALESSQHHLQELLQRLEAELSALQRKKAVEALEQQSQVGSVSRRSFPAPATGGAPPDS